MTASRHAVVLDDEAGLSLDREDLGQRLPFTVSVSTGTGSGYRCGWAMRPDDDVELERALLMHRVRAVLSDVPGCRGGILGHRSHALVVGEKGPPCSAAPRRTAWGR